MSIAASRSQTYWLLSELYLERPSQAFLENLQERLAALARASGEAFPEAWAGLRAGLDARAAEGLAVEHTRLFGGLHPGQGLAPPYESVHRESQLLGDTTLAVVRAYGNAGFGAIFPAAGPQDHLGVELRFMSLAAHEEMEAWSRDARAAATDMLECQRTFLASHLIAWAPAYARALASQARMPFYAALGVLTERVLVDDHQLVQQRLADLAA
jgi:TorA maturation chaperone TorD